MATEGRTMHADDVLALGLGVTPTWKLAGQRLDPDNRISKLHSEVAAYGAQWAGRIETPAAIC